VQQLVQAKEEYEQEYQSNAKASLPSSLSAEELSILLKSISSSILTGKGNKSSGFSSWVNSLIDSNDPQVIRHTVNNLAGMLAYCYEIIAAMSADSQLFLHQNLSAEAERQQKLESKIKEAVDMERLRELETKAMEFNDPLLRNLVNLSSEKVSIGSHLAPLSYVESRAKVQSRFPTNNDARSLAASNRALASAISSQKASKFDDFTSWEDLAQSLVQQHSRIRESLNLVLMTLRSKDVSYDGIKEELIEQLVERRKREEEVVNWSYILKYLLNTSSKLKKQLQEEKKLRSSVLSSPSFEAEAKPALAEMQPPPSLPRAPSSSSAAAALFKPSNYVTTPQPQNMEDDEDDEPQPRPYDEKMFRSLRNGTQIPATSSSSSIQQPKNSVGSYPTIKPMASSRYPAHESSDENIHVLSNRFETPRPAMDYPPRSSSATTGKSLDPPAFRENRDRDRDDQSAVDSDLISSASFRSAVASIDSKPPSHLARSIVQDLGVEGQAAVAAMQVIDRVSQITPAQLDQLDPSTRAQILQIRRDLGIEERLQRSSSSSRPPRATNNAQRDRQPSSMSRSYDSIADEGEDDQMYIASAADRARIMMEAKRFQRNMNTPGSVASSSSSYPKQRSSSASRSRLPSSSVASSTRYEDENYPPISMQQQQQQQARASYRRADL
jgi:hypothetical protein